MGAYWLVSLERLLNDCQENIPSPPTGMITVSVDLRTVTKVVAVCIGGF
jgi:hypothetical protein